MSDRELTMDDYLAMVKRRLKVILIPTLVAPLTGFLVSYELAPRYQTQSTVLVEGQTVPDNLVTPVITSDFAQRVQTLNQEVLSPSRLRPMLQTLGYNNTQEQNRLIGEIQQNMQVTPMYTTMSAAVAASPTAKKKPSASNEPLPGINVIYTDRDAERAQKICNALTSLIVDENLRSRSKVATDTQDFLSRQVDDAKRALDDQDKKLAEFKKQHMGELPTDVDSNMRLLMAANSQLDATTQTLSRAQQDKTYAESMLAQQLASWKTSQSTTTNPQTLEQELTTLQAQLLQLQSRYTDDYPDVVKTKADIAKVEKRLKEVNTPSTTESAADPTKANAPEPPEIRQLRLQIHQYQDVINQATLDQKKLQSQINLYQARTSMSPAIEEQYKLLTRDNDNAQSFYQGLLAKRSSAGVGVNMENAQEGEQMHIVATASLPDAPSFPNRPVLAAGGLGVGLVLGALIAIFLEFSDKSIRTEKDAAAIMDLPLLISVPWLGSEEESAANGNGGGKRSFWGRRDSADTKDQEHVQV